jgi:hypothetical protein
MQEERYPGLRDRSYSAWHRRLSLRRFVGLERAQLASMIDLDACVYCEFDGTTREPLALIETAMDRGQGQKAASVTRRLAQRAMIPAYCVLYRIGSEKNPADPIYWDIDQFRVRRLWPRPEHSWRTLTPEEWAQALLKIRTWAAIRLDKEAANEPVYAAGGQRS